MPNPLNRIRNWRGVGIFMVLALVQLVSYQNCGSDFVVKDGLPFSSASSGTCEASLAADFQSSYYAFLKTNCATCHSSRGPGNGAFADGLSDVAFAAFLSTGHAKIDLNATNSAHSGQSGPQNSSAISLAGQQWDNALASCKGGAGTGTGIMTTEKVMQATATAKDITWNLDSELNQAGNTGGATLTIAVREAPSANGTPVYFFSNPRIKGGSKSVTVKGLMIKLNGQEQALGSTWSRVDSTAAAGATVVMSTATILLEYASYSASDTVSLSIDTVTAQ